MKIPVRANRTTHANTDSIGATLFDEHGEVSSITAGAMSEVGSSFYIPLLVPVNNPTGDGRKFIPGSLSSRELPLPLMWQFKSSAGHDQSVLVGRIDSIEVDRHGIRNVRGVFDTGP